MLRRVPKWSISMRILATSLLIVLASARTFAAEEHLALVAQFAPSTVALGDSFRLRLEVVNRGDQPVRAFLFFDNGAAVLHWTGESNHAFDRPALHSMADYFPEQIRHTLHELGPGELAGVEILSSPDPRRSLIFYDDVQIGCYQVVATLELKNYSLHEEDGVGSPLATTLESRPARICFQASDLQTIIEYSDMLRSTDPREIAAAVNFLTLVHDPRVVARLPVVLGQPSGWTSRLADMAVAGTIEIFVSQQWQGSLAYLRVAERQERFRKKALDAERRIAGSSTPTQ